nr:hypothetical protein [Tanacetum cinerariifolium]
MMSKKKVNTKPVDYAALNQLSQDFETQFVPQTELSAEQAFWCQNSRNSEESNLSSSTTIVESLEIDNLKHTLSELLKENECLEQKVTLLKKDFQKEESQNIDKELALEKQLELKLYDGSVIQKIDAIVIRDFEETLMLEDEWNFEESNLSSSTTIVEVPKELPKVSMAVEQHCVEKNKLQDKMKDVLKENERLLEQVMSTNIVNIVVNANVNYA